MKTKDERNARRRELRIEQSLRRCEQHRNAWQAMYRRAAKEHWSHQRMLAYEREWLNGTTCICGPALKTDWERAYVKGVQDVLYAQHWQYLTFCYPHPDKPWMMRPAKELCDAGLASRLNTSKGNHYYRSEDWEWVNIANEYVDAFDRPLASEVTIES